MKERKNKPMDHSEKNTKNAIIAMPALTSALRGETLLSSSGFLVRVIKLPAGAAKKGCAYGLETGMLFAADALKHLESAGIAHGELIVGLL